MYSRFQPVSISQLEMVPGSIPTNGAMKRLNTLQQSGRRCLQVLARRILPTTHSLPHRSRAFRPAHTWSYLRRMALRLVVPLELRQQLQDACAMHVPSLRRPKQSVAALVSLPPVSVGRMAAFGPQSKIGWEQEQSLHTSAAGAHQKQNWP